MHILIKKKNLIYKHYRIKCAVGKRGIGIKKKEGDFITPIGTFKIKYILYRKDRINKPKSVFKTLQITKKMGWCNDPISKKYNKLITYPFKYNAEKLYRKNNIYDILIVLNYNMKPIIKNKGSAIFIHVAKKNYSSTEGCVALKKNDLLKLIRNLTKKTSVKII